MNIKAFIATCGLAMCLLVQPGMAGQVSDGWRAIVDQDYPTALKLLRPLAEQGVPLAQTHLGSMYRNGTGVSQDKMEAMKWYRLAAEQNEPLAQVNIGRMYAEGEGVPQDFVLAHMWYNLSAASIKIRGADYTRDDLAKQMTPDQIAEAQRLAREWTAAHPKRCEGC